MSLPCITTTSATWLSARLTLSLAPMGLLPIPGVPLVARPLQLDSLLALHLLLTPTFSSPFQLPLVVVWCHMFLPSHLPPLQLGGCLVSHHFARPDIHPSSAQPSTTPTAVLDCFIAWVHSCSLTFIFICSSHFTFQSNQESKCVRTSWR